MTGTSLQGNVRQPGPFPRHVVDMSLAMLVAIAGSAAVVIQLARLRLNGSANHIADRNGFDDGLIGGLLLGAATSISDTIVSLTSALDGRASLAFSNGIAVRTAFADRTRKPSFA